MKIIIVDSGLGGKDFIKKLLVFINKQKNINIKCKFVKLFDNMVSSYDKKFVRNNLLRILYNEYSYKNINSIIIACHSASSCILDILIKNNFIINNINIYEPIIPMCLYIKEKKYKNILILSTPLTEKIRWHYRLLSTNNIKIKYLTFPLLAKQIENNNNFNISIKRLKKQKEYIKKYDCVILGCTHYNIIKDVILNELTKYNFNGVVLDSNEILVKYYEKNLIQKFIYV
jgi:glutamate racemase